MLCVRGYAQKVSKATHYTMLGNLDIQTVYQDFDWSVQWNCVRPAAHSCSQVLLDLGFQGAVPPEPSDSEHKPIQTQGGADILQNVGTLSRGRGKIIFLSWACDGGIAGQVKAE